MLEAIESFLGSTGIAKFGSLELFGKTLIMYLIVGVLVYLAVVRKFEPLLLLPIAFGMLLTNLPGAEIFHMDWFIDGVPLMQHVIGEDGMAHLVPVLDENGAQLMTHEMIDIVKHIVNNGGFLDFISKYKDECAIDTLFYTFPSLSLPEAIYWKQSDNATMREFDYTVAQKLPNTNICFLHTGETFSFADLDFEVLFTHEDIYPDRIGSFNDTSTVLRVTCDGKSILFLGDLQDASCKKLEKMHGSYLKSDAVQVAHHGFNGSTIETYDLVAPELALWPTADYGYHGNKERAVNAHIIAMPCVKEHLIAGIFGTAKLTLPYTPGTAEPIDLPKKA